MQPFTLIERGRQAIERKLKRGQVRISFDIDDTLACQPEHAAAEHSRLPGFVHRWLGEPLRSGTRELIRDLRRQGCSIWIYTSSGRTPAYIRRWLLLYGIHVDGVVNSDRHQHILARNGLAHSPSKLPSAFDIDLHVDDSEGVRLEGVDHGFRVVVVCPQDKHWAQKVKAAAVDVQARLARQQPHRYEAPVRSSAARAAQSRAALAPT
ncbi:HAD family hydrolase, partial [Pseudomonas juntendi]